MLESKNKRGREEQEDRVKHNDKADCEVKDRDEQIEEAECESGKGEYGKDRENCKLCMLYANRTQWNLKNSKSKSPC